MSTTTSPLVADPRVQHMTVRASDSIALAVEDAGPRHTALPALLCLAGLTRTKRDFYALRDHFAFHPTHPRRVVLMDARGRGASDPDPDGTGYTVQREADDAAAVSTALGLHGCVIVGTSRGGMLAMVLAITKPGLFSASVLNDIGPRIAGTGLTRLKQQLPNASIPHSWDEAETLVRNAMQDQFTAFKDEDWAHYARLTFDEVNGQPSRAFDPALLEPLSALPDGLPFIDLSGPFKALATRPMLLLRGETSDLLDIEALNAAKALGVRARTVPGQGHAPALRGDVLGHIEAFLATL